MYSEKEDVSINIIIRNPVSKREKESEVIYGIHPLIELLKAKRRKLLALYTTKPFPKAWHQLEKLLNRDIPIKIVERDYLTRLAGSNEHQGVVGLAAPFILRKKPFETAKQPFLVMVDGVQDTRNLGAIFRSAYCTGANGVVIIERQGAPINASTIKASAGLAEHLEIVSYPTASKAVQELKKAGYAIYLAALGGTNTLQVNFSMPLVVVIGSEGTGISKEILGEGTKIMLPQKTSDISYNASVAAGILLFLIATQNKKI